MRRLALAVFAVGLGACESGADIEVRLERPTLEALDPYGPAAGVTKVRMVVRGDERGEEAIVDAEPGTDVLRLEGLPAEEVEIEVFGFDPVGNVRAYGRLGATPAGDGLSVELPFRRNLAYVIHEPNPGQNAPDGVVYVLDVVTRTLVDRVRLPGGAPSAASITARGGESLLISMTDGFAASVVVLSTADHTMTQVSLDIRPDLVLGVEGSNVAVAVGGSAITFVDLERGEVVGGAPDVGGRVLDAAMSRDGGRVLAAVDVYPPGLLEIDVQRRTVSGENLIVSPGGIALDRRSGVAYIVSSENQIVVGFDMQTGRASTLEVRDNVPASMGAPTGIAAYSEHMAGLFAVRDRRDGSQPRVYPFSVFARAGAQSGLPTFFDVRGIATDGPGRRVVVAGAGTSSATAGLTVIDTEFNELAPEQTNTLYPLDPDDADGRFGRRQRYQPAGLAIIYGQ